MEKKGKIILDLCGGTGSWSRPYKEAGYDVRLISLPEYDVRTYEPPRNVYGILAAPPCTEFSVAKGNRPRDFKTAVGVMEACLKIIWISRIDGSLKFWAMENPVGFMRQFVGKPAYTFEHWEFGDFQVKPTDLWGYFNAPKKKQKERPPMMSILNSNGRSNGRGWAKPQCPPQYEDYISQFRGDAKRAALRAITPPGFAEAFFRANR